MSNAVRGATGAQGSGGVAAGGGSSAARSTPGDGASFGGVLGAALTHPAQAADGADDRQGNGKGDGHQPPSASDSTAFATELPETGIGVLADAAPASGTGGAGLTSVGAVGRGGKKRPSDHTPADPAQSAQAAVAVAASLPPPAANSISVVPPTGAGGTAAIGALRSASGAKAAAAGAAAVSSLALGRPPTAGAHDHSPRSHELVGPEDGTGPREPDGIDPATATVGRPAAMALSGLGASLPAAASAASADIEAADTATTPVSGSLDQQPVGSATAASSQPSAMPAPMAVLAALAPAERDPNRDPHAAGGDVTVLGPTAGALALPSGTAVASTLPQATPNAGSSSAGANGGVNVVAPDGTSQPLDSALGSQLLAMVAAGRNQVTVHLSPPDLGSLTVHVEVQARDVSAWFASPQPQVQQAVSDALAQLHGALSGAGLNLSGAWVGADVSGGNGRSAATPAPVRRAATSAAAVEPAAAGATSVEGLSVYA